MRANILTFSQDESGLATTFSLGEGDVPGPDLVASFEAWQDGEAPVTQAVGGGASPSASGGALTMRPAAVAERVAQGATPPVPRATALASNTPFAADQTPVEADLSGIKPIKRELAAKTGDGRGYLALLAPDHIDAEKNCLAQASISRRAANRRRDRPPSPRSSSTACRSGLYPSTICGVVFQNRTVTGLPVLLRLRGQVPAHHRPGFMGARDAHRGRGAGWPDLARRRRRRDALSRQLRAAPLGRALKKMDVIGKHIFYRLNRADAKNARAARKRLWRS